MAGKQQPRDIETKLARDLATIRKEGIHRFATRVHRLEALLWISEEVGEGPTNYAKVLFILNQAAERLGDVYGPITLTLYGVDRSAQSLNSSRRTELAWEIFHTKEKERKISRNSFVSNEIKRIKADILSAILGLLEELPSRV
jgi:hypothetical protein